MSRSASLQRREAVAQSLNHDVAIVTGAGRGIGRAIALSLAGEGAAVGVFARTAEEIAETGALISGAGGRALALRADVRDAAAVRAAVSEMASKFGPVTLLVNNAGTPGPAGLDWEVDPEEWFECIDVIVRGAFILCQAVVPGMIARGSGRIINVASNSGTRARPPGHRYIDSENRIDSVQRGSRLAAQRARRPRFRHSSGHRAHPAAAILRSANPGGAVRPPGSCRIALRAACEWPVRSVVGTVLWN